MEPWNYLDQHLLQVDKQGQKEDIKSQTQKKWKKHIPESTGGSSYYGDDGGMEPRVMKLSLLQHE
ncbi:hypothetical protein A6R68_20081 [Neotoma lepida]|uniref:Uncharacterized protein n=1 Tax=Neotoma lepida TaxID=56216 RepID=A0A1A6HHT9_NEOLE|nr:hypothetical protein A6R68_20081 [Neotoma lepida]